MNDDPPSTIDAVNMLLYTILQKRIPSFTLHQEGTIDGHSSLPDLYAGLLGSEGDSADAAEFTSRVIRRLKVMARLNHWGNEQEQQSRFQLRALGALWEFHVRVGAMNAFARVDAESLDVVAG